MKYAFTEEQDDLRGLLREFLPEVSPESEVRRLMETQEGFDAGVWKQLGQELGIVGLAIPEQYGGLGQGFAAVGVVLEESGSALLCAPYFSTVVLAGSALTGTDDEDAKRDYLPRLAAGELRGTLAVAEDNGRPDLSGVELRARRVHGQWVLDGHKSYVIDGATAQLILVAARTEAGLSLFAVESGASGLTARALSTLDLTRKQARLGFDSVPARLIGVDGNAEPVLSRVLDLAALGLAAEQAGGAARTLDMAVEYAKVRFQYGRAIGSFQAIKHKCADMLLDVECARSAAYQGLWAMDDDSADLALAASVAKSRCSDAFTHCAYANIQIHGGIGFTWEHPAHLYLRRAKSTQLLYGDSAYHRTRVASLIGA
ncbi:MAG: acyl-CoA dehydrogenase family protein [Mycobacterium sp.]